MRTRHALLFGVVAATGAAAIGAGVAALLAEASADRIDRTYQAMARAFFTMPSCQDPPGGQRPGLMLVKGPHS